MHTQSRTHGDAIILDGVDLKRTARSLLRQLKSSAPPPTDLNQAMELVAKAAGFRDLRSACKPAPASSSHAQLLSPVTLRAIGSQFPVLPAQKRLVDALEMLVSGSDCVGIERRAGRWKVIAATALDRPNFVMTRSARGLTHKPEGDPDAERSGCPTRWLISRYVAVPVRSVQLVELYLADHIDLEQPGYTASGANVREQLIGAALAPVLQRMSALPRLNQEQAIDEALECQQQRQRERAPEPEGLP